MKKSLSHPHIRTRRVLSGASLLIFTFTLAIVLGWAHPAAAGAAVTFGEMLCNSITQGLGPMPDLIEACGYIAGTAFIGQGLYMLVKYHDNPASQPIHQPLTRLGGGAFLLALPSAVTALIKTLFIVPSGGGIGACAQGAVVAGPGLLGLDVLLTNLVQNIADPITNLTSDAAVIIGVVMIVRGLIKASKFGIDPRENSMPKILANLVVGAVLMVVGQTFTDLLNTLFGIGAGVTGSAVVGGWTIMTSLGASPQFIQAVQDAGLFMELIGMIAFVRGWMIIKTASEGSGQATMAQGITHLLGGVVAMNIFGFLQIMDNTFGTSFL
ncbi:MAG: hypothetical protein M3N08_03495 [Pseudomonadota bacterium]|nr:hypothetical protein [Pseudomonadota bacterium]